MIGAPIFRWEDFNTLVATETPWLVEGLIPRVGVGFLIGDIGIGKSFLALDWAAKISRGEPIFGCRTDQAGVAFVGAEDPTGLRKRIEVLRQSLGPAAHPFDFTGDSLDLRDPAHVSAFSASVHRRCADMKAAGSRLGLLGLDTFPACIVGADENSSPEMSTAVGALAKLASYLDCFVLCNAHYGKDRTRGLRGWSGMQAAADLVITLSPTKGAKGLVKGRIEKQRNGPSGLDFTFRLRPVSAQLPGRKEPVKSLLVEEAGALGGATEQDFLSTKDQDILAVIRSGLTVANDNEEPSSSSPWVQVSAVKDRVLATELIVGPSEEAVSRAFRRRINKLVEHRCIERDKDKVRVIEPDNPDSVRTSSALSVPD